MNWRVSAASSATPSTREVDVSRPTESATRGVPCDGAAPPSAGAPSSAVPAPPRASDGLRAHCESHDVCAPRASSIRLRSELQFPPPRPRVATEPAGSGRCTHLLRVLNRAKEAPRGAPTALVVGPILSDQKPSTHHITASSRERHRLRSRSPRPSLATPCSLPRQEGRRSERARTPP